MDDKKLLNGKFTFKSCVVQKKQASLLSENVNRQLAESKEVVGLPFIGNLTVRDRKSTRLHSTTLFRSLLKVVLCKRSKLHCCLKMSTGSWLKAKKVVGLPFIGNLTITVHCFLNKRPDCYVPSKLEKKKILSHGLTAL